MSAFRRGEVWSGSYTDGFPFTCIVISSNAYNELMYSALIVPFAGKPGDAGNPFAVSHPRFGACFPDRVAWVLASELGEHLDDMPADLMATVDARLRFVQGL